MPEKTPVFPTRNTLLLTLALAGCGATAEHAPDGAADAVTIVAGAPQWPAGGGWQVDSTPSTVLGADESDPHQQWQYIDAAARLSDGRIAIAVTGSIRLFDAEGRFLKVISASGQGPGEFRSVSELHVLPGDTLRASGSFGLQVAYFAPDGALVRDERTEREKFTALGPWAECGAYFLADGSRIGCKRDPSIPRSETNRPALVGEGGMSSPGPGRYRPLSRFWIAAPALDTAYPLGIDAGLESFGVEVAPGREEFVMHPFYGRSFVASGGAPLRIAIATNPEYRIEWWTPTGTLERVITRPGARLAPTDEDRAGAVASLEKQYAQVDPAVRRTLLAAIPTPDSFPAVYGMVVTPTGELLVQRSGLLHTQPVSTWDVFGADGAFLGEIRIAGHVRLISVGSDHLLAMRRTEDDAWLVEVYGLRR